MRNDEFPHTFKSGILKGETINSNKEYDDMRAKRRAELGLGILKAEGEDAKMSLAMKTARIFRIVRKNTHITEDEAYVILEQIMNIVEA